MWSDGREAEGARLLSVYRDKIPIPGSNPGRSASFLPDSGTKKNHQRES